MCCILCIVFQGMWFMHCLICILFYELQYMHCIICTLFYVLYSMHSFIYIVFYSVFLFIILYALYCQAQPQLQLAELALFSICPTRNNMEIAGNEQNLLSNICRYTLVELTTILKFWMEDNLNGRRPPQKMTSMEDDLSSWNPATTPSGRISNEPGEKERERERKKGPLIGQHTHYARTNIH